MRGRPGKDGTLSPDSHIGNRRLAQLSLCAVAAAEQPGEARFVSDVVLKLHSLFARASAPTASDVERELADVNVTCDDGGYERADRILDTALLQPASVTLRRDHPTSALRHRLQRVSKAAVGAVEKAADAAGPPPAVALLHKRLGGSRGSWFDPRRGVGVRALFNSAAPARRLPVAVLACLPSAPLSWVLAVRSGGDAVLGVAGAADGAAELRGLLTDDAGTAAFGTDPIPPPDRPDGPDGPDTDTPPPDADPPPAACHEAVLTAAKVVAEEVAAAARAAGVTAAGLRLSSVGFGSAGAAAAVAASLLLQPGGGMHGAAGGDVVLMGTAPFLAAAEPLAGLLPAGTPQPSWVVADGDPIPFCLHPAVAARPAALTSCAVPHSVLSADRHHWLARLRPPPHVSLIGGPTGGVRRVSWSDAERGHSRALDGLRPLGLSKHRLRRYVTLLCDAAAVSAARSDQALRSLAPATAAEPTISELSSLEAGHRRGAQSVSVSGEMLHSLEEETAGLRATARAEAEHGGQLFSVLSQQLIEARQREAEYRREVAAWEEERLRRDTAMTIIESQLDTDRRAQREAEEQSARQLRRIASLEAQLESGLERERALVEKVDAEAAGWREERMAWHAAEVRLRAELADAERGRAEVAAEADAVQCALDDARRRLSSSERAATDELANLRLRLQREQAAAQSTRESKEAAERAAIEAATSLRQQVASLRTALRDQKLARDMDTQRSADRELALRAAAEAAEAAAAAARGEAAERHREAARRAADASAARAVESEALATELDTLKAVNVTQQEQIACLAASLAANERELESTRRMLDEKEKCFVASAVALKTERATMQTRIDLLEAELADKLRRGQKREEETKAIRSDALSREKQVKEECKISVKQASDRVHQLEADVEAARWKLGREQQQREALAEELRAVRAEREEQVDALTREADVLRSRVAELDVVVADNLHYKILKESSDRQEEELRYLRNKTRALAEKLQTGEIERSVLSEQRWRDAEARARSLQVNLFDCEEARRGADEVLEGIVPLITDGPLSGTVPSKVLEQLHTWQTCKAAGPSAMGRRLLDPLPTASPSGTVSPAQVGVCASQSDRSPSLPSTLRKTVDSAPYYSAQRAKEAPNIYDLDW